MYASRPYINPHSTLIPDQEKHAVEMLMRTHKQMEWWIDEFSSAAELLAYCEKEVIKLQKQKSKVLAEKQDKVTLVRLFGSLDERSQATAASHQIRQKLARVEHKHYGFREWAVIAAKGAALALHDFGHAHVHLIYYLSREAKSVNQMIDAEQRKIATKFFHDEFQTIYSAIRDGVTHMQEKFGPLPDGMNKHKPKRDDVLAFGLTLNRRRLTTLWKGEFHSVTVDDATIKKMEMLVEYWSDVLREPARISARTVPRTRPLVRRDV